MNKKRITGFLWAAFISVMIGIVTQALLSGGARLPFQAYLWNVGYSLSIGLPLFANGFLFEKFACLYIDWIKHPVRSIFRALAIHLIYTTIVIFTVNWFWIVVMGDQSWSVFLSRKATFIAQYIIFIMVASIIYAVSFFKSWRNEVQQSEMIKREALSLQYQVLQNQVNPHFLFNSLNVLGSLIDLDVPKAKKFTRELSLFYRDLLQFKDRDIISLKEEIDFVKRYIYLQQIRFGEALQVEIIANEKIEGKVIPLSLQALVENAIKHNEISQANPLNIVIAISDDYELIVENNLQPKTLLEETSKTGLHNLAARYRFLTEKEIIITNNNRYFRVSLPLIILKD
ncbi:MAG: histidine kinase [Draconibacterium sp.]|nr:histidine kinase [Draconibacterium sp.]